MLDIIESLITIDPLKTTHLTTKTRILAYLLQKIKQPLFDSNQQYASELLSVLLLNMTETDLTVFITDEGVDIFLMSLSKYISKDPEEADEVEYMENLFGGLCTSLGDERVKSVFLKAEGIELMLIMIKFD